MGLDAMILVFWMLSIKPAFSLSSLAFIKVAWAAQIWEGHKMHAQPSETEPELCLSISHGGAGQQWPAAGSGALGAAYLSMA